MLLLQVVYRAVSWTPGRERLKSKKQFNLLKARGGNYCFYNIGLVNGKNHLSFPFQLEKESLFSSNPFKKFKNFVFSCPLMLGKGDLVLCIKSSYVSTYRF